jgi:hypothetical protein
MGRLRRAWTSGVLFSLLAGCASIATPYQADLGENPVAGGYIEERLAEGRYDVTFSATPHTPSRAIERYLLRRCAELTLEEGFDWFRVVERNTLRDVHVYVAPDNSYRVRYSSGYASWQSYWRLHRYGLGLGDVSGDPVWWHKLSSSRNRRVEASAQIVMGRGPAPAEETATFDARRLLADPAFSAGP